jgi:hypothetical protein
LILGAMDAASLGMMSGSLVMSRNSWRSVITQWRVQHEDVLQEASRRRKTQEATAGRDSQWCANSKKHEAATGGNKTSE